MNSIDQISRPNAPQLMSDAFAHCIFPLTDAADLQREGPIVFAQGEGANITDIDGKTYLDMMGSGARANSLGYGNEEIARAMYEQARTAHYVGTGSALTAPMVQLATKVASLAPGALSKMVFVSGGSEAVETALKIAKQYQQNTAKPRAYKTISRWNAYHGATMGALSVTDWLGVREVFDPRLPGHSFVANPTRWRNPYGIESDDEYAELCAKHLERQIQFENPDLVSAFIGEPIMQANGVQIPPKAYWQRVREICTKYGVMMIMDEVICGFGRVGYWFVSEYFGVEPDIMTMAKAITAGYAPMGAVITRPDIADAIPMFRHVHTFSGHAVSCAAANAVIAIKEREGLIPRARENGEYFREALQAAVGDHPMVGDVRGLGHWHAVELTADKKSRTPFTDGTVKEFVKRMRDLGVIAGAMGSAMEMAPPLIVSRADLDRAVDVTAQALHEIARIKGITS